MAKIFISSTYADLKECRERLYRALRQMKHDVIAMEDFVAKDERPLAQCLNSISQCDLYIGLFAWRYGFVPEKGNPTGKSITELEFRHAVNCGKTTLIFLLDENAHWPRSKMDDCHEFCRIELLRKELMDEYQVSFFRDSDSLAAEVSTSVSVWAQVEGRIITLKERLEKKYIDSNEEQKTKFTLVPNNQRDKVYQFTTSVFLEELIGLLEAHKQKEIIVGIVGGAALRDVVKSLPLRMQHLNMTDWKRLRFISLNMAGNSGYYQFSGNYLTVSLSEIFEGSSHSVVLPNWDERQRTAYNEHLTNLDLLVCSAGAKDGFLSTWLQRRNPPLKLPSSVIGDFCLLPINANGKIVKGSADLRDAINELRPNPSFSNLLEIRKKCKRVIFPITSNPIYFPKSNSKRNQFTSKEEVADAVLSSGIVNHCILDETLAGRILGDI